MSVGQRKNPQWELNPPVHHSGTLATELQLADSWWGRSYLLWRPYMFIVTSIQHTVWISNSKSMVCVNKERKSKMVIFNLGKKMIFKKDEYSVCRVVPNSQQPAELTGYLGRLCRLLLWYMYCFKDKLFVPLLAHLYENETYFPLQFIDLKIIWLAQRYTIICSLRWDLGITCRKPLKAWVYTNKLEKIRLLLELSDVIGNLCSESRKFRFWGLQM